MQALLKYTSSPNTLMGMMVKVLNMSRLRLSHRVELKALSTTVLQMAKSKANNMKVLNMDTNRASILRAKLKRVLIMSMFQTRILQAVNMNTFLVSIMQALNTSKLKASGLKVFSMSTVKPKSMVRTVSTPTMNMPAACIVKVVARNMAKLNTMNIMSVKKARRVKLKKKLQFFGVQFKHHRC